jgi:hypothetical protein
VAVKARGELGPENRCTVRGFAEHVRKISDHDDLRSRTIQVMRNGRSGVTPRVGAEGVPRHDTDGSKPFISSPCWSGPANAVAPSTHSRPQFGLFFEASIWVRSGPVELSSSCTGMPVALVKALVIAES